MDDIDSVVRFPEYTYLDIYISMENFHHHPSKKNCGIMIQWLLLLMMITEGLAELTCIKSGSIYFPRDNDKCRAPDFNTAFNNGEDLMTNCRGDGSVSIFCVWSCSPPCVWGTRTFGWVACLCLFFLPLLHCFKPEMYKRKKKDILIECAAYSFLSLST